MKIKTSELTGPALDWAVAKAEYSYGTDGKTNRYSTDWSQGGPIAEREGIGSLPPDGHRGGAWQAFYWNPTQHDLTFDEACTSRSYGSTELVAKMRCFVDSRLGDEVEVPDELA